MIDTLIQFVLHPMGIITMVQQFIGFPFQVGKIKQALFLLDALEIAQQTMTGVIPCGRDLVILQTCLLVT